MTDEETGGWRKLHEEFHCLHSSGYGTMIKLRTRWAENAARIRENVKERNQMENLGVDGTI
jgi:hypothetical protein